MRRSDQRRAAVFAGYQHEVTDAPIDELLERGGIAPTSDDRSSREAAPPAVTDFTRELVHGVEAKRDRLDRLIAEHSIGWELDRIAPLERSILRVALYEILYRPDVPKEVAIDEAVETAKLYCGADAPGFVNGILGSVVKRAANEMKGGRR